MEMQIPLLVLVFVSMVVPNLVIGDLTPNFYQSSCPQAESIILGVVRTRFTTDPSITPALLRMHFHDCFVNGCDASILIDSTKQNSSEKDAGPNQTVRGYDLIDTIKNALEKACPSTVSCADIITVATRDAVALAGGPNYTIPTGRRDGVVSNADDVNLPGPSITVAQAFQLFKGKGLTSISDMVTLLGAHTVGVAHCSFFQDRLSNFQGTGAPDSSMDPALVANFTRICSSSANADPSVNLDQSTGFVFDNAFYRQLLLKRGVLEIDQGLALDRSSGGIVSGFARDSDGFKQSFGNAMVKLGNVQVLEGNAGQIRKNCRVFNG
ncbi:peroxidase 57-like [Euphorbia lathyris]|uniref:peroxidase 57-like n=1 Tax=Euphorbia lathyris TaxID=212925 RepID=UPI003314025E